MLLTYFIKRNNTWHFVTKCIERKRILLDVNYNIIAVCIDQPVINKLNIDKSQLHQLNVNCYVYNNDLFQLLKNDNKHDEFID